MKDKLKYLIKKYTFVVNQEEFNEREKLKNDIIEGIEKLENAIGILKAKPFVLEFGLSVFEWYEEEKNYYYYHEYTEYFGEDLEYRCEEYYLTQQEYELLKEVLV